MKRKYTYAPALDSKEIQTLRREQLRKEFFSSKAEAIDPSTSLQTFVKTKETVIVAQEKKPQVIEKPTETKPSIALSQPATPKMDSLDPWKKLIAKVLPYITLKDEPMSDEIAKRVMSSWQDKNKIPSVPILIFNEKKPHFLTSVAKAIELCFFSSKLVDIGTFEKEKKWDVFFTSNQLKCIIISQEMLWQTPGLMTYYKEIPQQGLRTLGNIPVILLANTELYLKDPKLKASLWSLLCQTLKPLVSKS